MALRESAGLHNGAVWQAPNKLRIVLTWLGTDRWTLMSEPEPSRHGDYCMVPHTNEKGIWLWDGDYLPELLAGWTYLPDESLGPLISKSAAAPVPAREWIPVGELGEDGRTWIRPCGEFHDGRFERVDALKSAGKESPK